MKDKIAVILVLLLLIVGFIRAYKKELELNRYGVYTDGKIISFSHTSKTEYELKYVFFVKSVRYEGVLLTGYFECDDGSVGCVGKSFEVIYSSKNPKYNEIVLGRYEEYTDVIRFVPLKAKK